ncbi:MAG: 2'-5' RNA ligase family protein [Myxococcales bacterium]|nr:2'-5' RNA ligase family protein [Myxococcales bacterium]
MNLAFPTYICLDVPEPQASHVAAVRRRHCERLREFPVEITVAGSSGIGAIRPQLQWHEVERDLRAFCAATRPIAAEFGGVVRFPDTDIFSLALGDPMPFEALHAALKQSGVRFEDSQFPFFPHCTLRMQGPLTEAAVSELFALRVPGRFVLSTLSLYQREGDAPIRSVWTCRLGA